MALRIEPYKVRGTQASLKSGCVDVHHVHDIPQLGRGSTLAQALVASDPSIPFRMPIRTQFHPTLPGLECDDVIAREFMGAPTKAIVQVVWKPVEAEDPITQSGAQPTIVRISSSGRTTTTAFDVKGKPLEVFWHDDPLKQGQVESGAPPAGTKKYPGRAPIFEPGDIIEIERTELMSPWLLRKQYRRRLNADAIWGEKPRRFLFLGVSGTQEFHQVNTSNPRPRPWRNTYALEFRPEAPEGEGWDFTLAYIDSRTGYPPATVTPKNQEFKTDSDEVKGIGWKRFRMYKTAMFRPLRLPDIRKSTS